jgi:hypothetical protein
LKINAIPKSTIILKTTNNLLAVIGLKKEKGTITKIVGGGNGENFPFSLIP